MSTVDETYDSSTNSNITEINNAYNDFSNQSASNLVNDDLFETQAVQKSTINGQKDGSIPEVGAQVRTMLCFVF